MEEVCKLCGEKKALCNSHTVPKFIVNYLKETSPTGYLRGGDNVNLRLQDGFKKYLFCKCCEDKFSVIENYFANIFKKFNYNNQSVISYDNNLNKFAYTLSLRTILFRNDSLLGIPLTISYDYWTKIFLLNKFDFCYNHYILFLDEKNMIKHFDKHILLNLLEYNVSSEYIDYFRRLFHSYIRRSVDTDILVDELKKIIYIYNKLPGIIIICPIMYGDYRFDFENLNCLINNSGKINIYQQEICDGSFWEIICERIIKLNKSISQKQSDIIRNSFLKNKSRFYNSESFKIWGNFMER